MLRRILQCFAVFFTTTLVAADSVPPMEAPKSELAAGKVRVVVIPVREQVDSPLLFIIRRGLKEAIEEKANDKANVVVLDMKTPGGALDATFEIMEALAKFPGKTITFINSEALSAGAFISATTEEIWFAPDGVIGAAAPVLATGGEIDVSMKQKVVSYLKARVRATSEGKGYRGQVISAMIDADYELKIEDKVIKAKGELLSLTAKEASEQHGDPARPLLAAGIAKSVNDLLTQKYGAENFSVKTLEITWSERFAVFLRALSPLLLARACSRSTSNSRHPVSAYSGSLASPASRSCFLATSSPGCPATSPCSYLDSGCCSCSSSCFSCPGRWSSRSPGSC
jgi:membrane-bound serine protease (ClpP class)